MQRLHRFSVLLIIMFCVIWGGCRQKTSGSANGAAPADSVAAVANTPVSSLSGMVISDIPFPFEILDQLHQHRVPFNGNVMNPVANSVKYNQYNMKALNLGVYGADLAYAVTYEQFQHIGTYIKTTKQLAEELNIPVAFDQNMLDKFDRNSDNKDSLTQAVYDSYTKVDNELKNGERKGMAALVVTGSWLEGLYLSARTFMDAPKSEDNSSLYKTIGKQKKSLEIVVRLLEEYNSDPFFAALIAELEEITNEYSGTSSSQLLNERQLIAITQKVQKLRGRIIEGL